MLTSLYIHIPFCQKICIYCDFNKEMAKPSKITNYVNALIKEINDQKESLKYIETIFIGGGTPSHLPNHLLDKLLSEIQAVVNMKNILEYTIETNPNDISKEFVETIVQFGINRVSMGVQTFDAKILRFLNRSHQPKDITKAYNLLIENGITNINLDMIFGLPFQTMSDLENDLQKVLDLEPNHISYYSLIWEENTTLYYLYEKGKIGITDEDLEAKMYNKVIDTLQIHGYNHYEISSFAKAGKKSHHNQAYWTMKEYLGIGSGAHSFGDNKRFYHTRNVTKYINQILNGHQDVNHDEDSNPKTDAILMGLRLMDGFHVSSWNEKYQADLFKTYPKVDEFIQNGLLKYQNGKLSFTRKGLLLGNIVFEEFVEG
jgi:oxygen-independent coproporphyrinogen-3 oxidase